MKNRSSESGSIIIYLIMALVLMAALVVYMTQGTKKGPQSQQLDEMSQYLESDLKVIDSAINDCVLTYSRAVDVDNDGDKDATDNPNAPFPLYGTLGSGGAGTAIANIKCPGAPTAKQVIFNNGPGRNFRLLSGSDYTVTYFTDGTEGVRITISRASASDIWSEAISRLNTKLATCQAEVDSAGDCANGCLKYWVKRRSTSTATEGGCP